MEVGATTVVITVDTVVVGIAVGHRLQLERLLELLLLTPITDQPPFITPRNTFTRHNLKLLPIALRMDCTTRKHRPAQVVGNESLIKF